MRTRRGFVAICFLMPWFLDLDEVVVTAEHLLLFADELDTAHDVQVQRAIVENVSIVVDDLLAALILHEDRENFPERHDDVAMMPSVNEAMSSNVMTLYLLKKCFVVSSIDTHA